MMLVLVKLFLFSNVWVLVCICLVRVLIFVSEVLGVLMVGWVIFVLFSLC